MAKSIGNISWKEGWLPQITKLKELKSANIAVRKVVQFQNDILIRRYDFVNGECVMIPDDLLENSLMED